MGSGYFCRCPKCKYEFSASYGVGFMYPYVYNEALDDARKGSFGKETESFLSENPEAAIDASMTVYRCPKCQNLQCEPNLGLYIEKDKLQKKTAKDLPWSVAVPATNVSYVLPSELQTTYRLIKPYKHTCEKCNSKMYLLEEEAFLRAIHQHKLLCPAWKTALEEGDRIMWD